MPLRLRVRGGAGWVSNATIPSVPCSDLLPAVDDAAMSFRLRGLHHVSGPLGEVAITWSSEASIKWGRTLIVAATCAPVLVVVRPALARILETRPGSAGLLSFAAEAVRPCRGSPGRRLPGRPPAQRRARG